MEENIKKNGEEYADKHFIDDTEVLIGKPWPEAKEHYKKMLMSFAGEMLSGRCLVEKSRLQDEYKQAKLDYGPYDAIDSDYNQGKMDVLESLFPGIAKEVEE